nr:MAG TPA: hypothetical protein [Caudoviricetes sp.]
MGRLKSANRAIIDRSSTQQGRHHAGLFLSPVVGRIFF